MWCSLKSGCGHFNVASISLISQDDANNGENFRDKSEHFLAIEVAISVVCEQTRRQFISGRDALQEGKRNEMNEAHKGIR